MRRMPRYLGWKILLHSFATSVIAVLVSIPALSWMQVEMFRTSLELGMEVNYFAVALHIGLSACLWALIVIGYSLFELRRKEAKGVTRVLKQAKGTVMTETLIVLVPFLLLTSGLAQLSQLTITGMLADLAVFQAARVVFVWAPEPSQPRYESAYGRNQIRDRARTIAAMSLAPTAPGDYTVGRIPVTGSSDYFRRQRAIMVGAFKFGNPTTNYAWSGEDLSSAGAWGLSVGDAVGKGVQYDKGFDIHGFDYRAARKMTQAEWGMWNHFETICPDNCDINNSTESGVHFTYWYNIVFPWFGYLWGDLETVGMRTGYYSKIERRHTFPALPMP